MRLIAFEGPDGSGKTTLLNSAVNILEEKGYKPVAVAEPPDNPIGQLIKANLKGEIELSTLSLTLLFQAGRHELYRKLERYRDTDILILTDRCFISTFIYQGMLEGLQWELIRNLTELAVPNWAVPELVIVADAPEEILLERLKGKISPSKYDRLSLERLRLLREAYLNLPYMMPNLRFIYIDTTKPLQVNLQEVLRELNICE